MARYRKGDKDPDRFAHLADEEDALQAAGLCGAPNRPGSRWRFCHAQQKTKGRPTRPSPGHKRRCRRHGGSVPVGPANPAWGKSPPNKLPETPPSPAGRYSTILGGRYLEAYEASRGSGELPDLVEQIALCDAREARLVEVIEDRRRGRGETGQGWKSAQRWVREARRHMAAGDVEAFQGAMSELAKVVEGGAGEEVAWDEFRRNAMTRRHLVDTQRKLVGAIGGYVSVIELVGIAAAFVAMLRESVLDRAVLAKLLEGVERVMSGATSRAPLAISGEVLERGE